MSGICKQPISQSLGDIRIAPQVVSFIDGNVLQRESNQGLKKASLYGNARRIYRPCDLIFMSDDRKTAEIG